MNREKKIVDPIHFTGNKMHQKTIILDLNFKHEEETKRHSNDWLRAKCKLRKISAFLLLYSVLVKSIFDCRVTNSEFLVLVNMQVTLSRQLL